uniref:Uncharacterized protein n=1 Tax=Zea mays TaxID=4577 RepID=C4J0K1_MAIZE|nr:unknown [Zea mays]
MAVTEPMVSHAESVRTSACSLTIRFIEKASVSVTASGRPSGMATTMMVMACWKMPTSAVKTVLKETWCLSNVGLPCSSLVLPVKWRAVSTAKTRTATAIPTLPMLEVRASRRSWSGVGSVFSLVMLPIISPQAVSVPTAVTSMWPHPSMTLTPEARNGFFSASMSTGCGSPVMLDSSTCSAWPCMKTPSAGTASPMLSTTTSPTTTSKMESSCLLPPRTTATVMLSDSVASLSKRLAWPWLLTADTAATRKTARKMLTPSYQPSLRPCSLMPKPSETAAQTSSTRRKASLSASHTWVQNPLGFLRGYVFPPKASRRSRTSRSSPRMPVSASDASADAIPAAPPRRRKQSWRLSLTRHLKPSSCAATENSAGAASSDRDVLAAAPGPQPSSSILIST